MNNVKQTRYQSGPIILVVDDTPVNLDILTKMLSIRNYRIVTAGSGREALDHIETCETLPDLVLLDIMMPGIDGFEVCARLKASQRTVDMPVIFLSGRSDTEDVVKGFTLGAVDYVLKPFKPQELLARVETHIELKIARDLRNQDLMMAKNIQESLLPRDLDAIDGIEFAVRYLPLDVVGGDTYDVAVIGKGVVRVMLADAMGHGVQAAMQTMLISSEYAKIRDTIRDPANVLEILNTVLMMSYRSLNIFFTCVVFDIDLNSMKLSYASGGHASQLLAASRGCVPMPSTGKVIGIIPNSRFRTVEHPLERGDRIFLFSDGLFEQYRVPGNLFGEKRLEEAVAAGRDGSIVSAVERIFSDLDSFLSDGRPVKQVDDITLIGMEVR